MPPGLPMKEWKDFIPTTRPVLFDILLVDVHEEAGEPVLLVAILDHMQGKEVLVDGPWIIKGDAGLLGILEDGLEGGSQAIALTLAVVTAEEVVVDGLQHDLLPSLGWPPAGW